MSPIDVWYHVWDEGPLVFRWDGKGRPWQYCYVVLPQDNSWPPELLAKVMPHVRH